uniref:Uncharacterized protein n=2 Tax=Timema TaxID=61471 RepID=A0A7R9P082_9NEOP|nr:unnamed protein product [Timema bartmani]CAD7462621.1 unnamed protein product [Timema tahoe]
MVKLCRQELKLERLSVDSQLALEMFEDNTHKSQQIPHIASQISHDNKVILYRVGDHVDISRGPMVGDTSFVGRCTFTANAARFPSNTNITESYTPTAVAL